jgi:hypothetical protein
VPGKAAYLEFEDDPDLEFEFFLAKELGGMTVTEMRARMSNQEFVYWSRFYSRRDAERELAEGRGAA